MSCESLCTVVAYHWFKSSEIRWGVGLFIPHIVWSSQLYSINSNAQFGDHILWTSGMMSAHISDGPNKRTIAKCPTKQLQSSLRLSMWATTHSTVHGFGGWSQSSPLKSSVASSCSASLVELGSHSVSESVLSKR